MINKNLKKLFNKHQIIKLSNINFKLRPAEINQKYIIGLRKFMRKTSKNIFF